MQYEGTHSCYEPSEDTVWLVAELDQAGQMLAKAEMPQPTQVLDHAPRE